MAVFRGQVAVSELAQPCPGGRKTCPAGPPTTGSTPVPTEQNPGWFRDHLTITDAAAPATTVGAVVGVFDVAALLCLPSLALLFVLQQRDAP